MEDAVKAGGDKQECLEFQSGPWPALLSPKLGRLSGDGTQRANGNGSQPDNFGSEASLYWLLSVYSPGSADTIDWTAGSYKPTVRGGRVESTSESGAEKKSVRMIAEGSVVAALSEPMGIAVDVAPDGFVHPIYRSGLALALRLPVLDEMTLRGPVEAPADGDFEQRPCEEPTTLQSNGDSILKEDVTETPLAEEKPPDEI